MRGHRRSFASSQVSWLSYELRGGSMQARADRSTPTGKLIDAYLKREIEMDDHAAHLLFSANRWEVMAALEAEIARGTSVVLDRYAYSGVAFSAAKNVHGMDRAWCAAPDSGLPQPDVVVFMTVHPEEAEGRGGFGAERYERTDFQQSVVKQFEQLRTGVGRGTNAHGEGGSVWRVVDANGSMDAVAVRVRDAVRAALERREGPLRRLWDGRHRV
jgi:dTMP kinase